MKKYRKLVAALVGVAALIALRYYEVNLLGLEPIVLDLITGALTAFGVYQVPNEPM
jgi:hypothetical protein